MHSRLSLKYRRPFPVAFQRAVLLVITLNLLAWAQTTFPASAAVLTSGATFQNDANGGYALSFHLDQSAMKWSSIDGAQGGMFKIDIIAAAANNNAKLDLWVNDTMRQLVRFKNSGGWASFVPTTVYARLTPGMNTVMLKHDFWYNQAANIQKMTVTPSTDSMALSHCNCKPWPVSHIYDTVTSFATRPAESIAARYKSRPVRDFLQSIALNAGAITRPAVFDRATQLGIRHWRVGTLTDTASYSLLRRLHQQIGAMFDIIVDIRASCMADLTPLFVQNHDIISSIESTNEPDADEFNGKTTIPDWEEQVCRFQKEIWDSVHAQPLLANIPVLGPSLIRGFSYNRGVGDLSGALDYINVHPYYAGFSPENHGWGGNGYGSVEYTRTTFSPPAPGKPLIATETGGAVSDRNPDSIQVLYLPRVYAFHFNHGIDRTFWFQLSDEARGFGILDSSDNPRPVYYTLLNFLTILRDTTATATAPFALNYTFGGDTTDVEGTLLSRPDGQFDLLLWIGRSSWDPNAKTSTVIPEQNVTLAFAGAVDSLRMAQPDRGTSFTPVSVNGSTASISVSNHLRIFRIRPKRTITTVGSVMQRTFHAPSKPRLDLRKDRIVIEQGTRGTAGYREFNVQGMVLASPRHLPNVKQPAARSDVIWRY